LDFLKRHYEKVILMGLLLAFISIMIRVVIIVNQTQQITEDDLQIPHMDANYEVHDSASDELRPEVFLKKTGLVWNASTVRDVKSFANFYTDLLAPFPMAVCPHCKALAPRCFFEDGKRCPECGQELKTPPRSGSYRAFIPTKDDSDGDGIKDQEEDRFGLDKLNPYDSQYDLDGDGFTNVYEIQQGYSPLIAAQHPPFWERLRFLGMNRIVLPVKFLGIKAPEGAEDANLFELQFSSVNKRGRERKFSKRINDRLDRYSEIPGEIYNYQITQAGYHQKDGKNVAFVTLAPIAEGGRENVKLPPMLVMVEGEQVLSSDARPEFEDVGEFAQNGEGYHRFFVQVGDRFSVGNAKSGRSYYNLDSISADGTSAILRNNSAKGDKTLDVKGRKMLVTRDGAIPPSLWLIHKRKN